MRTPRAWSVRWMGLVAGTVAALLAPKAFGQPVATDDFYTTNQATPLNVADANGILVNDTTDGGNLQAALVTNVANGILLFGGNGGFFYLPNLAFTGNDSFTYQARSPGGGSNVATVTISVLPAGGGNVPPVARADAYTTGEDQALDVAAAMGVLANDLDANSDALTMATALFARVVAVEVVTATRSMCPPRKSLTALPVPE